jgi:hypothetical protein
MLKAMASPPPPARPSPETKRARQQAPETKRARQQALIACIAAGRTVIEAAAEAGIGWRRAYVWRAEDAAFRAAWDRARAQIKARVPPPAETSEAELVVPPAPDEPALPPFAVPPSPPLPPLPAPPAPVRITVRRFDWQDEEDEDLQPPVPSAG